MSFPQLASYGSPEIQTVIAWHEALNSGDVERLIALSHPEVEVGGPRGSAQGAQILREWVDRANIRWYPDVPSTKPERWSWNRGRSGNPQTLVMSRAWPPCSW